MMASPRSKAGGYPNRGFGLEGRRRPSGSWPALTLISGVVLSVWGMAPAAAADPSVPASPVSGSDSPAPNTPAPNTPTPLTDDPVADPTAPSDVQPGAQPPSPTTPQQAAPAADPTLGDTPAQQPTPTPAPAAPDATLAAAGTMSPTEVADVVEVPPGVLPERLPPREDRPFAIWGSMGWNSLAGFAFGASYSFTPHLAADVAVGLSAVRFKSGARLRYNLFEGNWTPTVGLGFQYGAGYGDELVALDSENDEDDAELIIERSAFLQAIAGMSYQSNGGFNALFGVGYSALLDETNVRLVSGSEKTADVVRVLTGSGFVLEAALGYAF